MTMELPVNLYGFYQSNPDTFLSKSNIVKKSIYYALAAFCLILIIYPNFIAFAPWLLRIIGVVGLIVFGLAAYAGATNYYNRQSGGKIEPLSIKKFDSRSITEEQLLDYFNTNNIQALADLPSLDNQPLQLYIHEDKMGKTFYLQLMKYYSSSDFRGLSAVKVLNEPEYSMYHDIIKRIEST